MKNLNQIYWILAALFAALFFRGFLVSVYKVSTPTMKPTLIAGDFVLSSQIAYRLHFPWSREEYFKSNPQRSDLVVFQYTVEKAGPKSMAQYLKRVVAVADDEIQIQNQKLSINGVPCTYQAESEPTGDEQVFQETCLKQTRSVVLKLSNDNKDLSQILKFKVPKDEVFVLSDNRLIQEDSRDLGTIGIDQIVSKVSLIWFSYGSTQESISKANQIRWNRILTKPR